MCLYRVIKKYAEPDAAERYGWKVFAQQANDIFAEYHPRTEVIQQSSNPPRPDLEKAVPYPVGEWMAANETPLRTEGPASDYYTSGFHFFKSKEDAENYAGAGLRLGIVKVRRVKVRGVHTEGTQLAFWYVEGGYTSHAHIPTLVAKEMMIEPEEV